MSEPKFVLEEVNDPAVAARLRAQHERARRNSDWLQEHWGEVLPQARGKFLAVAGGEAFIAEGLGEARGWAISTHPEDDGFLIQYVRPERGPRFYGSSLRWHG